MAMMTCVHGLIKCLKLQENFNSRVNEPIQTLQSKIKRGKTILDI